jgi:hypothetical protein
MSSSIHRDIDAGAKLTNAVGQQDLVAEQMRRVGLSMRQVELNRLYSYSRAMQHDNCRVDWDGMNHPTSIDREAIVSQAFLPAGWRDGGGNLDGMPLRFRRPSVPCHLGKVIPARFTALLVGEGTHPQWKVPGQPNTEAWIEAVCDLYGFWAKMAVVRDLGGAMGTAVAGFKVIDGRVVFEELDARWCFPTFSPRDPGELEMLEVRYMYPQETLDKWTGKWRTDNYWYRRIVDKQVDCLWKPQLVGDGTQEPAWADPATVANMVTHGLGFVPIQWTQNIEVTGDIDGDPDCHGCWDYFDRIGELKSQGHKGAVKNADPTVTLASDGNYAQVQMGSDQVLKMEKGGTAGYLETSGSSIKTADDEARAIRAMALETAECVLPDQDDSEGGPITATEMVKKTAAMYSKAARMRQQYGSRMFVPLMTKLVKAAKMLDKGVVRKGENGESMIVRQKIDLAPKQDGDQLTEHTLDQSDHVHLKLEWPPFAEPTPQDTSAVATATSLLVLNGIISKRTAVRKVAPHYNIEDVDAEVAQAAKEKPAAPADFGAQSLQELNEGR